MAEYWKRLESELEAARRAALSRQQSIEPSEEEKRNGWTTETLTKYLTERLAGQSLIVDVHSLHRRQLPDEQNHRYRVHRWRR